MLASSGCHDRVSQTGGQTQTFRFWRLDVEHQGASRHDKEGPPFLAASGHLLAVSAVCTRRERGTPGSPPVLIRTLALLD